MKNITVLTDIDAYEVSLVDHPAIKQGWVVVRYDQSKESNLSLGDNLMNEIKGTEAEELDTVANSTEASDTDEIVVLADNSDVTEVTEVQPEESDEAKDDNSPEEVVDNTSEEPTESNEEDSELTEEVAEEVTTEEEVVLREDVSDNQKTTGLIQLSAVISSISDKIDTLEARVNGVLVQLSEINEKLTAVKESELTEEESGVAVEVIEEELSTVNLREEAGKAEEEVSIRNRNSPLPGVASEEKVEENPHELYMQGLDYFNYNNNTRDRLRDALERAYS